MVLLWWLGDDYDVDLMVIMIIEYDDDQIDDGGYEQDDDFDIWRWQLCCWCREDDDVDGVNKEHIEMSRSMIHWESWECLT